MIKLDKNSIINEGDIVNIEFEHLTNFEKINVKIFGILRNKYDNENSLSACLDKIITIYNISGKINENNTPRVFCWYDKGFKLLGGIYGADYGAEDDVELFKLEEEEKAKLLSHITKIKIVETIKNSG